MADYGRYGAFIKCGSETRSIRDKNPLKVLEVTIEECVTLLAKPRGSSHCGGPEGTRRGSSTKKAVRLMDGRYGPYVTDGTTNASLGKDLEPDGLTLEMAVDLIRAREKAPKTKKRKARRRRSPDLSRRAGPTLARSYGVPRRRGRARGRTEPSPLHDAHRWRRWRPYRAH